VKEMTRDIEGIGWGIKIVGYSHIFTLAGSAQAIMQIAVQQP